MTNMEKLAVIADKTGNKANHALLISLNLDPEDPAVVSDIESKGIAIMQTVERTDHLSLMTQYAHIINIQESGDEVKKNNSILEMREAYHGAKENVLKHYRGGDYCEQDLKDFGSEADISFMEALSKFKLYDPKTEEFGGYAKTCMENGVNQYIVDNYTHYTKHGYKLVRVLQQYMTDHNLDWKDWTEKQISIAADELDWGIPKVRRVIKEAYNRHDSSYEEMNDKYYDSSSSTVIPMDIATVEPDPSETVFMQQRDGIIRIVEETLSDEQKDLTDLISGNGDEEKPLSMAATAEKTGITPYFVKKQFAVVKAKYIEPLAKNGIDKDTWRTA